MHLNPPMAGGGGGGGWMPLPTSFQFFSGMRKAFFQTNFFAVGSSLGHLSMQKFVQIVPTILALWP